MLDVGRHRSDLARAIADVRSWVEQSICSDGSTVLVAELACHKPGCPPRETVIAILNGRGSQTWKVACPAADLSADDVTAFTVLCSLKFLKIFTRPMDSRMA